MSSEIANLPNLLLMLHDLNRTTVRAEPVEAHESIHISTGSMRTDSWIKRSEAIGQLRGLIQSARRQALRAVDTLQVRTYWEIGRHIVEFEQQGAARAAYGARLIATLAESLTFEFWRGFDASNLRYMRLFTKPSRFMTHCVPN
jgi:hypothetical protein